MIPDPATSPTIPLWPDVAKAFGMGRAKVFELARAGRLPFEVYQLGRSWRAPTAAVRRALQLDPETKQSAPG